jgi:gas vesicle protein
MNTEEEQQSEHFLISKILPRVVEDWSRENNSLLQQWSSYCSQRFLPSPKTLGQWQQLLSKYETTFQAYENHRNERERNRISFQVNLFYKDIQQRENEIIKMKESIRAITKEIEGKTNQTSETKRTGEKSKNELDKLQYKLAALKNKLRKLTDPSDGKILLLRYVVNLCFFFAPFYHCSHGFFFMTIEVIILTDCIFPILSLL